MMKIKRGERLAAMARILTAAPNRLHTLGEFCVLFDTAKSTISEDIDILRASFDKFHLGTISTIAGASGGVVYRSLLSSKTSNEILDMIAKKLSEPGRVLPGGFLYTADIWSDPDTVGKVGDIIASMYCEAEPDLVFTMETSGIPIALMTARSLDIPLVIARRDSRVYEGTAMKISYDAGHDKVETMTLTRSAVHAGQKALIVDDFAKGGGTLRGMQALMKEFDASVIGTCVMIATAQPEVKLVDNYKALLVIDSTDTTTKSAVVTPTHFD